MKFMTVKMQCVFSTNYTIFTVQTVILKIFNHLLYLSASSNNLETFLLLHFLIFALLSVKTNF